MRKTILIFMGVTIIAAVARGCFGFLSHQFYWDEFSYVEVATRILQGDFQMGYERIPGWSFLISIFNYFFDSLNMAGIYLNIFFSSLTVGVSYLAFRYFKCPTWIEIVHALFWIFSVKHIIWSRAGETNISSLFFVSLFWLLCLSFWFRPSLVKVFSLATVSLIALTIRIENGLLFVILLYVFWTRRQQIPVLKSFPFLLLPLVLVGPMMNAVKYYLSYNWSQLAFGSESNQNYSLMNIIANVTHSSHLLYEILNSPVLWLLFAIGVGKACVAQKEYVNAAALFFVMYFLVYFSGWLRFLGPDRVFVVFMPFLFLLSAYGLFALSQIFRQAHTQPKIKLGSAIGIGLIIFAELLPEERIYFLIFVFLYAASEWARGRFNLKLSYPRYVLVIPALVAFIIFGSVSDFENFEMTNDDERILMTQVPQQLRSYVKEGDVIYVQAEDSLNFIPDLKVRNATVLLENKNAGEGTRTYYLSDISCSLTKDWLMNLHQENCQKMLSQISMTPEKTFEYGSAVYTLYRVNSPAK